MVGGGSRPRTASRLCNRRQRISTARAMRRHRYDGQVIHRTPLERGPNQDRISNSLAFRLRSRCGAQEHCRAPGLAASVHWGAQGFDILRRPVPAARLEFRGLRAQSCLSDAAADGLPVRLRHGALAVRARVLVGRGLSMGTTWRGHREHALRRMGGTVRRACEGLPKRGNLSHQCFSSQRD